MNRFLKTLQIVLLSSLLSACDSLDKPTLGLHLAIQRGDIDQIQRHIEWGADINQIDTSGRQLLHIAAKQGELVIIRLLLKHGADINGLDGNSHSPLHAALMEGKTQVASFLIKKGAANDPNSLLLAAIDNRVADRDVFRLLASLGADVNHLDNKGRTPLILAINTDDRVLVKYLITQGTDLNKRNKEGVSPLRLATNRANTDIIRLLKRNGARLEP